VAGQKKAQKKAPGKKAEAPAIPAEAGKPTQSAHQQARAARIEAGKVNKHGGKVFAVDEERGVVPNSENGHDKLAAAEKKMVTVDVPVSIRFNNKTFLPGQHIVPEHVAQQIRHMVYKKRKSDEAVHVGRNFSWNKGSGRKKVVERHDDL
jgi:hypothetical protein